KPPPLGTSSAGLLPRFFLPILRQTLAATMRRRSAAIRPCATRSSGRSPAGCSCTHPSAHRPALGRTRMAESDSYRAPQAAGEAPASTGTALAAEPRRVDAGRGVEWIKEGWNLFKRDALTWLGLTLVALVVF